MLMSDVLWCPVMEIACGEYGDVVPKLVVAAQSDSHVKFNSSCIYEIKPNNCDKSMNYELDPKCLLQDGVNVGALSPDYSELLTVDKVDGDHSTVENNDSFTSLWKTVNVSSSDESVASSQPVSRWSILHCDTDSWHSCNMTLLYHQSMAIGVWSRHRIGWRPNSQKLMVLVIRHIDEDKT